MLWSISDVKDTEAYRLHLCQAANGERFFRLVTLGSAADKSPPMDAVFSSRPVPNQLLRRRDVMAIAESVPLDSGEKFCVDAHGIWFTTAELAAMSSGMDFSEIRWVTARAPKLTSR